MIQWRELKYLLAYLVPLSCFVALFFGGPWSFATPVLGFVIIPVLELFFKGTTRNLSKSIEKEYRSKRFFDWMLYLNVPFQWGLLVFFLIRLYNGGLAPYEIVGMTASMGMCSGVLGINVAHELGHRRKKYEQVMAKALLLSTLYMHFFIEHNRGHHKNVSTPEDPASSRYGEPIYTFWFRSIFGAWLSAWRIENARVKKAGQALWNPLHNEMVRFHLLEIGLVTAVGLIFGWKIMLAFLASSFIGYLLLESVNYIEHYGLQRRQVAPGRYERCMPWHSWNANETLGRIVLYDLTRHSDHHYLASRKYQILRHFDESPQLPTGYPGAIVMALVPPLWFHVMHKRIQQLNDEGKRVLPEHMQSKVA